MTDDTNPIRAICTEYGLTQTALSKRFGIPLRTVQDWYAGRRTSPTYVPAMMRELLSRSDAPQK